MSLNITLVSNDTMVLVVIRKLKSLSLSLFGIDIGYGNKLVGLRQGDEIKVRFQEHWVIPQIYFATMLSLLFFLLELLIVH